MVNGEEAATFARPAYIKEVLSTLDGLIEGF
jgi:hypothetical protein